ncbi:DUF4926 domain-containing protein [Roseofilum casamattae]|uniref:DUF4926 domain-containing protein n=1 Tax=Roseofilum casamattae BLCC-M143 TaxID=3022442 RepID=A0ABT7BZL9_9CYAN|nr:DUF4926 domain-containing protein [Roseofilum casamattae]MDJ1184646.1 DUF4926 domain-containing protein [Roseofilum casamattae BLCC-M143]
MKTFQLLDSIALLQPIAMERLTLIEPEYRSILSLPTGQVGTIVEIYDRAPEPQYLVEFCDSQGCEYAMAILKENEILALHYSSVELQ